MDTLVIALGPAFAAGLAVQQFLEFADPLLDQFKYVKRYKRMVMSSASVVIGLVLAFGAGLRVLEPMGYTKAGLFDPLITGLIISAGTEGLNSILKFLGYAKARQKQEACCAPEAQEVEDHRPRLKRAA